MDLGLDSLGLVELPAALESQFNLKLRDEDFNGIFTVRELIDFIEAKNPEAAKESEEEMAAWCKMLMTDPSPAMLRRLGMEGGLTARMATQGLASVLGSWFKCMFDLKVHGREKLKDRGYILCSNHASFLDGFILAYAVPGPLRHRLFSLGYSGYFDVPVLRDLLKLIRVIPVDSSRTAVAAMQVASYILRNGRLLSIFPEGFRTPTGEVGQFKKGVAILARELDVKLVPVYIHGSYEAWPPGTTLPRPRPIQVIFGREHAWGELRDRGLSVAPAATDYDAIRLGLREEVLRLKKALGEK